jgi:hypothetical protein
VTLRDYRYVLSNPRAERVQWCTIQGMQATWPAISMIRNNTLLEIVLDECVAKLRARLEARAASASAGAGASFSGRVPSALADDTAFDVCDVFAADAASVGSAGDAESTPRLRGARAPHPSVGMGLHVRRGSLGSASTGIDRPRSRLTALPQPGGAGSAGASDTAPDGASLPRAGAVAPLGESGSVVSAPASAPGSPGSAARSPHRAAGAVHASRVLPLAVRGAEDDLLVVAAGADPAAMPALVAVSHALPDAQEGADAACSSGAGSARAGD